MPVNGKFELRPLAYAPQALEPVISAATLGFHHGKHLAAYVNNLNALLPGSGLDGLSLEEVVRRSTGGLLNNAGQLLNHNLYFAQFMAPRGGNRPNGDLAAAINDSFVKAGSGLFGSGWVWLSADNDGKLVITQEPNAANPVQRGLRPLMTMDVWEHAYYLDYQNRRPDHLTALWQIIDWNVVTARLR